MKFLEGYRRALDVNYEEDDILPATANNLAFIIVATTIFAMVAFTFLFPCNKLIPLDRRTMACLGTLLCYITRTFFINRSNRYELEDEKESSESFLLEAIDFNVLVLLSSIMIINHLVVHLKETKSLIEYLQNKVKENKRNGFWMISLAAFSASPFLTNDGVCLLFVEPILNAFNDVGDTEEDVGTSSTMEEGKDILTHKLEADDAIYMLLGLACSANIGSSLTYTGNPQNMIVASSSLHVLPSYKFLLYNILPAISTWLITSYFILYCWKGAKEKRMQSSDSTTFFNVNPMFDGSKMEAANSDFHHVKTPKKTNKKSLLSMSMCGIAMHCDQETPENSMQDVSLISPVSPTKKRRKDREVFFNKVAHVVSSPVPYMVLVLLGMMIIMIFVDIMPISVLVSITAMIMVCAVVYTNHVQNKRVWMQYDSKYYQSNDDCEDIMHGKNNVGDTFQNNNTDNITSSDNIKENAVFVSVPEESANVSGHSEDCSTLTPTEKKENLHQFFEELFNSIDYSLLLIFIGLFVVVENMEATGLPKKLWDYLVGNRPFKTAASITGISLWILISSQFLGNVAVIQLAKPNIDPLDDEAKRLAWAVVAFIATVGGNLTITGSAANIIVAEKAMRIDPDMEISFFVHYRVCFWVTLLSCAVGGVMLYGIASLDNYFGSNW